MKYLLIAILLLGAVSAQFSTGFEVETPAKEEAELTNFDEDNFDMEEGQDALDFDDEDDNTEFLDDEDEESDLPAGRESDDEGELESDQDEDSYVRLLF